MTGSAEKPVYYFGRKVLRAAQDARGLTNQQIANQLGFSASTWDRALKTGNVRTDHVIGVVQLLGLALPKDFPPDAPKTPWVIIEALEEISRSVQELVVGLREVRARLPPDPNQR